MSDENNDMNNAANNNKADKQMQKNISQTPPDDLPDSERDKERLKPETTIINLPDVDDIPGQEHVHVPSLGEISDTTISSDDEEGNDVFNNKQAPDH